MRVVIVAEQLRRAVPGGVGTYAHGLLRGLAAARAADVTVHGADVTVHGADVTVHGADVTVHASRTGERPDPLEAYGFPVRTSPLPSRGLTRAWDMGLVRLPRGYDVAHAVSLAFPSPRGRPRSRPSRPGLAVMVHDLSWRWLPDAFPPRGRRWHEASLARALERAAVLVVPSEATAADLRKEGAGRVEVIEEGCDHLPPPDGVAAGRLLAGLGVEGPYLLSVGTLEPRKNLPRLLAAYSRARDRLPEPWPLVVVGPRGWGPALEPGPGVVPAGAVAAEVLAGLYAGARCVAYVPLLEGFGLPAVEAMAHGAAVVASPMPSTAGAAVEVDPYDVESIAAGLIAAAGDDVVRETVTTAGRARAAALTWESAARRHVEVWQSLC